MNNFKRTKAIFIGLFASQILSTLGSLILVRIISPEIFGDYSSWLSMVTILTVISTLRLEIATVVTDKYRTLPHLISGGVYIVISLSAFLTTAVFLFDAISPNKIYSGKYVDYICIWIGTVFNGLYLLFNSALYRIEKVDNISIGRVLSVSTLYFFQIISSLFQSNFLLIISFCLSSAISTFYLFYIYNKNYKFYSNFRLSRIIYIFTKYRKYATYTLAADLINVLSTQLPILYIASSFGNSFAGIYAITVKILSAPYSLFGIAITDSYKMVAPGRYHTFGDCRSVFIKSLSILLSIACLGSIIFYSSGDVILSIIFSHKWDYAIEYIFILFPLFMTKLIVSPLSYTYYISGKTAYDFFWQFSNLIILLLIFYFSRDFLNFITLYNYIFLISYLIYFIVAFRLSKK